MIPSIDPRHNDLYEAWLHPKGHGIFIKMPRTSPSHFDDDERYWAWPCAEYNMEGEDFAPLDERGYEAYSTQMSEKTNEKNNSMILFFDFPETMRCSNVHFNKDEDDQNPDNSLTLLMKDKMKAIVLMEADKEAGIERIVHLKCWLRWEMEIINKENISRKKQKNKSSNLASRLSKLSIG